MHLHFRVAYNRGVVEPVLGLVARQLAQIQVRRGVSVGRHGDAHRHHPSVLLFTLEGELLRLGRQVQEGLVADDRLETLPAQGVRALVVHDGVQQLARHRDLARAADIFEGSEILQLRLLSLLNISRHQN